MPDSDERYTKAEREILEILDDMGEEQRKQPPDNVVEFRNRSRRPRFSFPDLGLSGRLRTLTPAKLFVAAIALIILAAFLRGASPMLSTILLIAAVMSFLSLFFVKSSASSISSPPRTKRWRGRDIQVNLGRSASSGRDWKRFWRGPRQ